MNKIKLNISDELKDNNRTTEDNSTENSQEDLTENLINGLTGDAAEDKTSGSTVDSRIFDETNASEASEISKSDNDLYNSSDNPNASEDIKNSEKNRETNNKRKKLLLALLFVVILFTVVVYVFLVYLPKKNADVKENPGKYFESLEYNEKTSTSGGLVLPSTKPNFSKIGLNLSKATKKETNVGTSYIWEKKTDNGESVVAIAKSKDISGKEVFYQLELRDIQNNFKRLTINNEFNLVYDKNGKYPYNLNKLYTKYVQRTSYTTDYKFNVYSDAKISETSSCVISLANSKNLPKSLSFAVNLPTKWNNLGLISFDGELRR
jgi:preprotein translocase subunit YajC